MRMTLGEVGVPMMPAVSNMQKYQDVTGSVPNPAKLSLSASLRTDDILGGQGGAVYELGSRLASSM